MSYVVGLDVGHRTVPAADSWIHTAVAALGREPSLIVCTHLTARPFPHVIVSLSGPTPPEVVAQRLRPYLRHRPPRSFSPNEIRWLSADTAVAVGNPDAVRAVGNPARVDTAWRPADTEAELAAQEHLLRRYGRAVIYPGSERLTGTMRVEEVLAESAIERITVFDGIPPGAIEPPGDAKIDTREHVRPQWSCGLLTLLVIPAADGLLVPFEGPPPRADQRLSRW
jgi:hypothetical protein